MKISRLYLPLLFIATAMTAACDSDSYETGDTSYSYMQADLCEVATDDDCSAQQVVMDDDTEWALQKAVTADWMERADTLYRALAYYNKVENAQGESRLDIVSLQKVPVVEPVDEISVNGLKTDPVEVVSVWKSRNAKYLNFRIRVKTGKADDDSASQTIGIVKKGKIKGEESSMSHLALHHVQGDVPEYYSQTILFSMPLASVETDSIDLSINTYNGEFSRKFSCGRDN